MVKLPAFRRGKIAIHDIHRFQPCYASIMLDSRTASEHMVDLFSAKLSPKSNLAEIGCERVPFSKESQNQRRQTIQ